MDENLTLKKFNDIEARLAANEASTKSFSDTLAGFSNKLDKALDLLVKEDEEDKKPEDEKKPDEEMKSKGDAPIEPSEAKTKALPFDEDKLIEKAVMAVKKSLNVSEVTETARPATGENKARTPEANEAKDDVKNPLSVARSAKPPTHREINEAFAADKARAVN